MFYKGQTSNLLQRLKRHNSKLESATKDGTPWILLWSTSKDSRAEAIKLERTLKNLSQKRLIEFMLKYREGIEGPDALLLVQQWSGC